MLLFALLYLAGSCRQTTPTEPVAQRREVPPQDGPRVEGPAVIIHTRGGPVTFHVEVARTDRDRMRGLMRRRDMADDHGMVFVFPEARHQVFWMKDTFIPLDMIFIKPDRTILGIVRNATPETEDPREVPGDSLWVFEINGGLSQRRGIQTGDRVEFIGIGPALE